MFERLVEGMTPASTLAALTAGRSAAPAAGPDGPADYGVDGVADGVDQADDDGVVGPADGGGDGTSADSAAPLNAATAAPTDHGVAASTGVAEPWAGLDGLDAVDGPAAVAVAALTAGVDALLAAGLDSLSCDGLLGLVSAVETQRRRLAAVDHRLIAQVESRAVAAEVGARDTRALLGQVLRLSPAEAGARVSPRRGTSAPAAG